MSCLGIQTIGQRNNSLHSSRISCPRISLLVATKLHRSGREPKTKQTTAVTRRTQTNQTRASFPSHIPFSYPSVCLDLSCTKVRKAPNPNTTPWECPPRHCVRGLKPRKPTMHAVWNSPLSCGPYRWSLGAPTEALAPQSRSD